MNPTIADDRLLGDAPRAAARRRRPPRPARTTADARRSGVRRGRRPAARPGRRAGYAGVGQRGDALRGVQHLVQVVRAPARRAGVGDVEADDGRARAAGSAATATPRSAPRAAGRALRRRLGSLVGDRRQPADRPTGDGQDDRAPPPAGTDGQRQVRAARCRRCRARRRCRRRSRPRGTTSGCCGRSGAAGPTACMFIDASTAADADAVDREADDRTAGRSGDDRDHRDARPRRRPGASRSAGAAAAPRADPVGERACRRRRSTETPNTIGRDDAVADAVAVLERRQVGEQHGEAQTLGGEGRGDGDPGTPRVGLHGAGIYSPGHGGRTDAGPTGRAPSSRIPVRQTHPRERRRAGRRRPRRGGPGAAGQGGRARVTRSPASRSPTGCWCTSTGWPGSARSTCRAGLVTVEAGMPLHELNDGAGPATAWRWPTWATSTSRRSPARSRPAPTARVTRSAAWPPRWSGWSW